MKVEKMHPRHKTCYKVKNIYDPIKLCMTSIELV